MIQRIAKGDLGQLDRIGAGGQGVVYKAPEFRRVGQSSQQPVVYKEFKQTNLQIMNVATLEELVGFADQLSSSEQQALFGRSTWPQVIVTSSSRFSGYLMPLIPDDFFLDIKVASGTLRKPAEFQHLFNPPDFIAKRGIRINDRDRYKLLTELAKALDFFHSNGLCVGDLSAKNILFSVDPARIFFVDCDSMVLNGESVATQFETPDWEVRKLNPTEPLATVDSDIYKFGLLALRLLSGDQSTRSIQRLPKTVPKSVKRLIENALSATPANRPRPELWCESLRKATDAASTKYGKASSDRPATAARPANTAKPSPIQPAKTYRGTPSRWGPGSRRWNALLRGAVFALFAGVPTVLLVAIVVASVTNDDPSQRTVELTIDENAEVLDSLAVGGTPGVANPDCEVSVTTWDYDGTLDIDLFDMADPSPYPPMESGTIQAPYGYFWESLWNESGTHLLLAGQPSYATDETVGRVLVVQRSDWSVVLRVDGSDAKWIRGKDELVYRSDDDELVKQSLDSESREVVAFSGNWRPSDSENAWVPDSRVENILMFDTESVIFYSTTGKYFVTPLTDVPNLRSFWIRRSEGERAHWILNDKALLFVDGEDLLKIELNEDVAGYITIGDRTEATMAAEFPRVAVHPSGEFAAVGLDEEIRILDLRTMTYYPLQLKSRDRPLEPSIAPYWASPTCLSARSNTLWDLNQIEDPILRTELVG